MAFTPIPLTDVDYSSPVDQALLTAFRDRNDWLRGLLYDPLKHRPKLAHDHDDVNSAGVFGRHVPNLILAGHPNQLWTVAGGCTMTAQGLRLTSATSRANIRLLSLQPAAGSGASKGAFGSGGCNLIISANVRKVGTVTDLDLRIGLGNSATGLPATKHFVVAHGDVTTSWKRFYGHVLFVPSGGTEVYAGVHSPTFAGGGSVEVDLVLVKPCQPGRLVHWQPGYCEEGAKYWGDTNEGTAPMFETATQFTNAVMKTVV